MANERLYQFPSKASPTPADIIFCGNAADAFNEVNITIAALIAAYPNLFSIGNLTLDANTYIYSNNSSVIGTGTITALGVSLLAGATTTAMQTTLGLLIGTNVPGIDVSGNVSANNFLSSLALVTTAAGTTTLTAASAYNQFFTGSTTQTVLMPVVTTLPKVGFSFYLVNNSSGNVTVQSSGGNNIQVMAAGTSALLTCILLTGTTAASWNCEYAFNGGSGSGTVNSGTQYNLAYYATSGVAVSGLTNAGAAGFGLLSGSPPTWSTGKPITQVIRTIFTAGGTWTIASGCQYVFVQEVGGGGGSGGAASTTGQGATSGGGGGGGYNEAWFTAAAAGASQTITIGAAGTAGTSSTSGGNGGQTSFGALLTANGGSLSPNGTSSTGNVSGGGAGGATSTGAGIFAINGQTGSNGMNFTATSSFYLPGSGGNSQLGFGGLGQAQLGNTATPGNVGTGYGAGASGAGISGTAGAVAGATGTAGVMIITEYVSV